MVPRVVPGVVPALVLWVVPGVVPELVSGVVHRVVPALVPALVPASVPMLVPELVPRVSGFLGFPGFPVPVSVSDPDCSLSFPFTWSSTRVLHTILHSFHFEIIM